MMNCYTKTNNKIATCRVCLGKSRGMTDIFQSELKSGMSIADMLWEATGFPIVPGDTFPKTICATCLQDGQNAFEIKQTYERSQQFLCEFQKNLKGKMDLHEPQVISIEEERLSPPRDEIIGHSSQIAVENTEDCNVKRTEDKFSFECSHCQKTFSHDRYIKRHIKRHSRLRFSQRPKLSLNEDPKTHQSKHTRERPYQCTFCRKKLLEEDISISIGYVHNLYFRKNASQK